MTFEFQTATRISFGAGVINEAPKMARSFGRRVLIVTGASPARSLTLNKSFGAEGMGRWTLSVFGEPTIEDVDRGLALAQSEGIEVIVGYGGGSVIDAAKAIAAMLTNEGELLDYLEVVGRGKALTKASAPFIAIPTTAGTGSEVTRNAVLASPEHKVKVSLRSSLMLPRVALVDPELTYDLPPALTASTGLDALTQLIEPYVCLRANPMTDALCVEGIRRTARSLRVAIADGQNKSAREDMALASLHGGLALANAGLGAVHGFAGPIGGMFPAPHGAVCAALLPHVMAMNLRALRERASGGEALRRYEEIARLLTGQPTATAADGVKWVSELVRDLGIPSLARYGLSAKHVAAVVANAANASSMKANPVALTPAELAEVLQRAADL